MSISNAFNITGSGLSMTAHWAEVVSNNIANADNPAYGRRTLTTTTYASGVVLATGVSRETDQSLTRLYREELSRMSRQSAIASGMQAYTTKLGGLDDANSPTQLLTDLQTSLDLLFNDPSQTSLQQATLQSAQGLARGLNVLSGNLDSAVSETEQRLSSDMTQANRLMKDLALLNERMLHAAPNSELFARLQDQQAGALNQLSEFMDLRVQTGANGAINLYTVGGTRLIEDDEVFDLSFNATTGRLTAGGYDITPPSITGISEGTLAGHVELLNTTLPQVRLQIDEFARGIIASFEGSDSSLLPGEAGLFTDNGLAYDSASLTGLAGRISVNDAVVPEAGGSLWRIRDGVGAITAGSAGDSGQIGAFIDALDAPQAFAGATGIPTGISLADYGAAMIASQQDIRATAEADYENYAASAASIDDARLNAQGVNIDDELQQLLMIEKNYAANSQVVSTLANMLDALLAAV